MLCPSKNDPNYEKEVKRFKEDPHAFGAPTIQRQISKAQRDKVQNGPNGK